jgi:sphinganine-1-phosphate aldolase
MDIESLSRKLRWVPPGVLAFLEKRLKKVPAVQKQIDQETAGMMVELETSLKPYSEKFPAYSQIPGEGLEHEQILGEMQTLRDLEFSTWKDGYVSGAVYHGDEKHVDFLNQIYALHSQTNPLHADVWPSITKYEAEVVAMTANMLGGGGTDEVCGTVSSGGTESILLAMKTYRDWGRDRKGIRNPEIVVPVTAHAAFEKAAQYFNLQMVRIPVGADMRADVRAAKRAITRNTVAVVGSAPSFPHGAIDPIQELSELALQKGIGFHTDACLGGFILPWAKKLGYPVPAFDFALPGVTSISADTHKYGYAAKGTSVLLLRGTDLRHYQYYATGDWPGGLYCTPTFAGSRPGALSAACWAAMVAMGESGYMDATRSILETAAWVKNEIRSIPQLHILGEPFWVIAFASDVLDIYQVMDSLGKRGWVLNGLFSPPAVHLCVTLRHTQPGVAQRFIDDLRASVEEVKREPQQHGSMAPVYGMAATFPLRGMVGDLLKSYLDVLYKV